MQARGVTHDAPSRNVVLPAAPGSRWIVQRSPFHISASATEPDLVKYWPTAKQRSADGHDTADSPAPRRAPAGLGTGWVRQPVPSQRSARGSSRSPLLKNWPTAVQARGDGQETPESPAETVSAGTGDRWIRQRLPSQRSASVVDSPVVAVPYPTAMQVRADAHDTPTRPLATEAPTRAGTACRCQLLPPQPAATGRPRWLAVS